MAHKSASVCVIIRYVGTRQEVLFIKRAVRATDRWSGHIALPGGHRDPGETHLETAVREAEEEVGIDLSRCADLVQSLEPRYINAALRNRKPMLLCPFVFVVRSEDAFKPLVPQVREVAAAFWYPLDALMQPANKTSVRVNVGDRLNLPGVWGSLAHRQLSEIVFPAIDIWPSNVQAAHGHSLPNAPWKLWGITLNILHEVLLSTYPAGQVAPLRTPTFSAWDMRVYHQLFAIVHYLWYGAIPQNGPPGSLLKMSREKVLPYALGASILGRIIALLSALLKIYRAITRKRI